MGYTLTIKQIHSLAVVIRALKVTANSPPDANKLPSGHRNNNILTACLGLPISDYVTPPVTCLAERTHLNRLLNKKLNKRTPKRTPTASKQKLQSKKENKHKSE